MLGWIAGIAWWVTSASGAPSTLDYTAPEGCPTADRYADEVSARIGRLAFGPGGDPVEVALWTKEGEGWFGAVHQGTYRRMLRGGTCGEVFAHLVTAMAVLMDGPTAPPVDRPVAPPVEIRPSPEALERYRRDRLEVRGLEAFEVKGPAPYVDPTGRHVWGVYDGRDRLLTAREFLQAVDAPDRLQRFERDQSRLSAAAMTLALVGGLALGGLVAPGADDGGITGEAALVVIGGSILVSTGAGIKIGQRQRLAYVNRHLDFREAEQLADQHNAALRDELGIADTDAR